MFTQSPFVPNLSSVTMALLHSPQAKAAQLRIDVERRQPRGGLNTLFDLRPLQSSDRRRPRWIIGCDSHARQQTLAMLETTSGEVAEEHFEARGKQPARVLFRSPTASACGHRSDRIHAAVCEPHGKSAASIGRGGVDRKLNPL